MKNKVLLVLHTSPPSHGASAVGDFIKSNKKINKSIDARYVSILSSNEISDIGGFSLKKIWYFLCTAFNIIVNLVRFRPDTIYFTSSVKGFAFYRDLLLSLFWKTYKIFKPRTKVFYHYHTKGVKKFIGNNKNRKRAVSYFLNDVNVIVLSKALTFDFDDICSIKNIYILPNGIEDKIDCESFESILTNRSSKDSIDVLYLSNMIPSKGCFRVLHLAKHYKNDKYKFHFAGGWKSNDDKKYFFDYVEQNDLKDSVFYHGFVSGEKKSKLLSNANALVFPTTYPFETFGLVLIEALSFGVPLVASNEASIPLIVDRCGVVINNVDDHEQLKNGLDKVIMEYNNTEVYMDCRNRYLNFYSSSVFEDKFLSIINIE